MARFAPLYEVPIENAEADVRATFFNTQKYGVDDERPFFEQVEIRLEVESPAPAAAVKRLLEHAERACHAAQSLRNPVPVTLAARLNGAALDT